MKMSAQANYAHASGTNNNQEDNSTAIPSKLEHLLDRLFNTLYKLWLQARRILHLVMTELGGNELVDAVATWCVQHPDLAICLVAVIVVFMLPLLVICGFGLSIMLITFTGILVVEGTLLTVAVLLLLACIGGLAMGTIIFGVVAYFGFSHISEILGMERHRDSFIRFMERNRNRGADNE